jgi:beta-lactamase class A
MRKRWPRGLGVGAGVGAALALAVAATQWGWGTALTDPVHSVAAAGVGAGGATRPAPTDPVSARKAADEAVAQLVAHRARGSVSVVAVDTVTGRTYRFGASSGMPMGSVAKVLLLEGYLLNDQDEGLAPGEGADDVLAAMIEQSDNDAADQIYEDLGGHDGVTELIGRLGLTATSLPASSDEWGLGTTSAADQVLLLRHLVTADGPLGEDSRAYALGLMQNVEDDQRWGVSAAADQGAQVALKNGWLGVDDDDDRWLINSDGILPIHGHTVLMSVLTQHDDGEDEGISLVESLAQAVAIDFPPGAAGASG